MSGTEINAITFAVTDMSRSVRFYTDLGFEIAYGGGDADFTSLRWGTNFVNLQLVGFEPGSNWGRVILHCPDPDAVHSRALAAGYEPEFAPRDAPWGERYFHLRDPDGHELSLARRLS